MEGRKGTLAAVFVLGLVVLAVGVCVFSAVGWWFLSTPDNGLSVGPVRLPRVANASSVSLRDFLVPHLAEGQTVHDLIQRCERGESPSLGYAAIEISPRQISLSGEPIINLDRVQIRDEHLNGFLVVPLHEALLAMVKLTQEISQGAGSECFRGDDRAFEARVLIIVDRQVPFEVLRHVLYTAGQVNFSEFAFLVDDPVPETPFPHQGWGRNGSRLNLTIALFSTGMELATTSSVLGDGPRRIPCPSSRCQARSDYDWLELRRLLNQIKDDFEKVEEVFVIPDGAMSFDSVAGAMDTVVFDQDRPEGTLFPKVYFAMLPDEEDTPRPVAAASLEEGRTIGVDEQLPVLMNWLPSFTLSVERTGQLGSETDLFDDLLENAGGLTVEPSNVPP